MTDALVTGGELGRARYKGCMGGFCSIRESCQHYTTEDRSNPSERLCEPRRDGEAVEMRRFRLEPVE
jgi:hypothetical protein